LNDRVPDPQPTAPTTPSPGLPSSAPHVSAADEAQAVAAVLDLLERARQRQRRLLQLTAGLLVAAAVLVLAPAFFGLAASGVAAARPLALGALLLAAGAFVWQGVLRVRREVGDPASTARLLASRLDSPDLRRGLLPAFELSRELARPRVDFSRALARAHIGQVAQRARQARLELALPDRTVRRAGRAFFFAALFFLGAVALFRGPMMRGARLVVWGREAPAAKSSTTAEPVTGDVELTYLYPAHTRLPSRTLPNTNGDISAPKGTQVRLKTRADREVEKAFALVGSAALPLEVKNGRDLSGTLLVESPGSYRFRLVGARGKVLAEGPPIPIAVEEDQRPKATIVAPMADVEVDPKSRVKIRYEADDDFGISELALLFKLPGASKPERVVLERAKDAPRRASGEYEWDLVAPALSPGDTVAYYLEATDNDEVSGKKTGVSRTQYLKIFSEAEHHRKLVQQIEAAWEKLVTLLADRLESAERKPDGRTPDKILGGAMLDSRALALASELAELSTTLRKDKSPEQLWQALALVAAGLKEKANATYNARTGAANWLRRGADAESDLVRRVARAVEVEIAEEEKDVLYLEALVDQQRIADLAALSKELSAKRRELADLLEKYRSAPDDAARDRLIKELARLKERMAALMQRMAELSKSINDEHFNAEALKEMGESQEMMDTFDKLQELLYQGKVEEAMKEMEKLGQKLDSLEQKLNKASQESQGGQYDPLAKDVSQFAKDLDQLQEDQQALLEDTQKVREHYKQALQEKLAKKGADFVEKLRKKTDETRKKLAEIKKPRSFWREDDLKRAKEQTEDLDKALAVKDFDQAAESAAKALMSAQQASDDFERAAQDARRYPQAFQEEAGLAQKNARNAKGAVQPLEEIKKELDSLQPPPAAAMSEQDRQAMKSMAQRQGQLQQKAGQLRQKMDEINQQAPLFPGEAQEMMQQVGGRMQRAQGKMQARDPTGSVAEERAALDQLGELEKGLQKQAGGGSGGGGQPMPWPWKGPGQEPQFGGNDGQGSDHDKVEIPNADQYTVPEEYRKDILDAMKQGAPEKYKDQVKRYYEEIVK
jgi:hypothetical protein